MDDCPDCAVTLRLVQADGGARLCSCGAELAPTARHHHGQPTAPDGAEEGIRR